MTQKIRQEARLRSIAMLSLVGIGNPERRLKKHAFQLSGEMRQRVMIAMGLACSPKVLIADESTTALDVTIQAQIVSLMKKIQREMGMGGIWITHVRLKSIQGAPPDMTNLPAGCPFADRCPQKMSQCAEVNPVLIQKEPEHEVACLKYC